MIYSIQVNPRYYKPEVITYCLKEKNKLEEIGGVSYLGSLTNAMPTSANAVQDAEIVVDNSKKRELIHIGSSIAALGYQNDEKSQDLIDEAEKKLLGISQRQNGMAFVKTEDILCKILDKHAELADRYNGQGFETSGLSTGFVDLDNLIGGFHPSDLIVLASATGMGKTALATNIAVNIAIRGNKEGLPKKRIAFFSMELNREQLMQRMICHEAEIDNKCWLTSKNALVSINDSSEKMFVAIDRLGNSELYIDDTPALNVMEISSRARRMRRDVGIDLIIIDYIQLMSGTVFYKDNRTQEISEITRKLKVLARELNVPILALSQLNRSVDERVVKKPMLSDLRDSGSLANDADIVMFLYRGDYYKIKEEPDHITELIVAKHRTGPVGRVNLFFKEDNNKFISLSRRPEIQINEIVI